MSKLYTEEQLLYTIKFVQYYIEHYGKSVLPSIIEKHLKALSPIQLPTDEEIKEEVSKLKFSKEGYRGGIIEGMIWMRDKIKGGGDE